MPFFSIITPTYNRVNDGKLKRCLNSVMTQTFEDFEMVVVDDGSTEDVRSLIENYDDRFRLVRQEHQGRIVARNTGMSSVSEKCTHITWLDSDDIFDPMYLATLTYYIKENPEYKLFVVGVIVHGQIRDENGIAIIPKWTKIRPAWTPPLDKSGQFVHQIFSSGKVGAGMFCFSRECLEKTGLMPDSWRHWEPIADGIDEWLGVPPGTTGYSAKKNLVGNPWGGDHCMYQKLCLHYESFRIPVALYTQYIK